LKLSRLLPLLPAASALPLATRQSAPSNGTAPVVPAAPFGSKPPDINALNAEVRQGFNDAWVEYVENRNLIPNHLAWHQANGPGGIGGEGTGERFLQYHANLIDGLKEYVGNGFPLNETGGQIPVWDTRRALPEEFTFSGNRTRTPRSQRPAYLTAEGIGGNQTSPCRIDGVAINSLNDVQTPDVLGRAIGECGYHASVHVELGGEMANTRSVARSPFMGHHGNIHDINRDWHATEPGQAWLAENPTGWTDPEANALPASNVTQGTARLLRALAFTLPAAVSSQNS
jgi:hypothetical protein